VQGADLQNGSTTGADTNDLDFGVDAEGVPYAVSDGDDQASGTVLKGNGTIAISYYVSSSSSVDKGVILEGNANNFGIEPRRDRNGFRIVVKNPQGNDVLLRNGGLGSSTQDAWQQAIITRVNVTDLRFNFNGTELSYSFNQKYDDSDLKISVADGRRVRQVEPHPVLSEAEAEAVRQRLANNPADPVAPTEAWDFTAETSPHNYVPVSEALDTWSKRGNLSVTQVLSSSPDPNSNHSVKIEDSNTSSLSYLRAGGSQWAIVSPISSDDKVTIGLFIKKHTSTNNVQWSLNQNAGPYSAFYLDPSNGDIIADGGSELNDFGVIDFNSSWFYCWMHITIEGANTDVINIAPAYNDGVLSTNNDSSATGTATVSAPRVVRGHVVRPPYVPTNGSVAYPQTVPSLTGRNDLQLGSTSGADTNDPDPVAPIGMAQGGDDRLRTEPQHPESPATWVGRVSTTSTRVFGRRENGWEVTDTELVLEDQSGNTASSSHNETVADGSEHVLVVVVDSHITETAKLYVDGQATPSATADISGLGTLNANDVELLPQ